MDNTENNNPINKKYEQENNTAKIALFSGLAFIVLILLLGLILYFYKTQSDQKSSNDIQNSLSVVEPSNQSEGTSETTNNDATKKELTIEDNALPDNTKADKEARTGAGQTKDENDNKDKNGKNSTVPISDGASGQGKKVTESDQTILTGDKSRVLASDLEKSRKLYESGKNFAKEKEYAQAYQSAVQARQLLSQNQQSSLQSQSEVLQLEIEKIDHFLKECIQKIPASPVVKDNKINSIQ